MRVPIKTSSPSGKTGAEESRNEPGAAPSCTRREVAKTVTSLKIGSALTDFIGRAENAGDL
jgi:hypothetical protein